MIKSYLYFRFPPLLLALFLPVSFTWAEMLKAGDAFPVLETRDQHDKPYSIAHGTRYVCVTFDMGAGKRANRFFAEKGADYLPGKHAVYLSNIYGMPGIARAFAMPKMRKYPHRILLADAKGLLDDYPNEKGKVTVFELDGDGKIASIAFWDPAGEQPPF